MSARPEKITFAEMRDSGVRGLLVYCSDYRCGHSIAISGDAWPDDVRLSDIEPRFVCSACGRRGADVRPALKGEFGMRPIQLAMLFVCFATSASAQVSTREIGQPLEVAGLADPAGCHPFNFIGTIVKREFADDAVRLTEIVVETADCSREFINVSVPDDLNMALKGKVAHGLQVLSRTGRKVTGKAFACGAAGRVYYLDEIR